jgi:hypothetical protein
MEAAQDTKKNHELRALRASSEYCDDVPRRVIMTAPIEGTWSGALEPIKKDAVGQLRGNWEARNFKVGRRDRTGEHIGYNFSFRRVVLRVNRSWKINFGLVWNFSKYSGSAPKPDFCQASETLRRSVAHLSVVCSSKMRGGFLQVRKNRKVESKKDRAAHRPGLAWIPERVLGR